MEALATNEIRQRKKKSDEILPKEGETETLCNDEMGKEIPPSEEGKELPPNLQEKETSPDAKREKDMPPSDDVCTICFGKYNIPCKTNCGHWYCAKCVLSYWTYSNILLRCKCPICSQSISKLTPAASLNRKDKEVVEALKKVQGYNSISAGGVRGLIFGFIPCLWRTFYVGLYDPDKLLLNYMIANAVALVLTLSYYCLGFNFLPGGFSGAGGIFQCCTAGVVIVLGAIGIYHGIVADYRRPRLRRRLRRNPVTAPKNPPVLGSVSAAIQDTGPLLSGA